MQKPDQPIVIHRDDNILQRQESPFCGVGPTQGYHEDPELLAAVADAVNDGLLTPYEASLVIAGKTL